MPPTIRTEDTPEPQAPVPDGSRPAGIATPPSPEAKARRQPFDDAMIEHLFTYHAPTPEQIPKYEALRAGAKVFAKILRDNTVPGADQAAAFRLLRECVMTANASVALDGKAA